MGSPHQKPVLKKSSSSATRRSFIKSNSVQAASMDPVSEDWRRNRTVSFKVSSPIPSSTIVLEKANQANKQLNNITEEEKDNLSSISVSSDGMLCD